MVWLSIQNINACHFKELYQIRFNYLFQQQKTFFILNTINIIQSFIEKNKKKSYHTWSQRSTLYPTNLFKTGPTRWLNLVRQWTSYIAVLDLIIVRPWIGHVAGLDLRVIKLIKPLKLSKSINHPYKHKTNLYL